MNHLFRPQFPCSLISVVRSPICLQCCGALTCPCKYSVPSSPTSFLFCPLRRPSCSVLYNVLPVPSSLTCPLVLLSYLLSLSSLVFRCCVKPVSFPIKLAMPSLDYFLHTTCCLLSSPSAHPIFSMCCYNKPCPNGAIHTASVTAQSYSLGIIDLSSFY